MQTTVEQAPFNHWDPEHPAAAGLHTKDFKLDHTKVFEAAPSDGRVGEVAAGPVIVARPGKPKIVVLGFHPVLTGCATNWRRRFCSPTCCAGSRPRSSAASEVSGGSVGAVKLTLDQETAAKDVKVTAEDGSAVPFTVQRAHA